jgi:hypothetical protein
MREFGAQGLLEERKRQGEERRGVLSSRRWHVVALCSSRRPMQRPVPSCRSFAREICTQFQPCRSHMPCLKI